MAHTFDIRFARSSSFAAWFEASANRFGWRGDGRLSIDPQGVDVGVKRGFASLFVRQRSQRIPADQIREVYREGDALRIEFSSDAQPREVLPLWARDRDVAAQIVELLPTTHTVEMEQSPDSRDARLPVQRTSLYFGAALIVAALGTWMAMSRRPPPEIIAQGPTTVELPPPGGPEPYVARASDSPAGTVAPTAPVPTTSAGPAPESPSSPTPDASVPVESAPPAAVSAATKPRQTTSPATAEAEPGDFVPDVPEIQVRAEDQVVPLSQGTLAYDTAREVLARFEAIAAQLSEKYQWLRDKADSNSLNSASFANGLDGLDSQWKKLSGTLDQHGKIDPALNGFMATLVAVTTYQSRFLSGYAAAIRANDADAVLKSLEDLKRADDMLIRARLYVH